MSAAVRQYFAFALLCMVCAWSSSQAVEFNANGASVHFPGPEARIEREVIESSMLRWQQAAPTPQDPQRALAVMGLHQIFWVNWLMRLVPEMMMINMRDKFATKLLTIYDDVGGADVEDIREVEISGHPGILLSVRRRDMSRTALQANGTPALLTNREYLSALMLWTGEGMVMAGAGGSRPMVDDAFFQSLHTATTVKPGDPDDQSALLCKIGGVVILGLLLLIIALVYVIDKTIQRRKRKKMQNAGYSMRLGS
jgi:hypothetical protein